MTTNENSQPTFSELNLAPAVLKAVQDVGYETPSPIQAQTIPFLLEGRDVLGQAQTGTGKTAAFALPLLSRIDLEKSSPQLLVLAPTRELAIQVAEAFQTYAKHLKGFHVLPIYGGQSYEIQLRALKRGVHVVVGTPGRVMDHMRRGTLKLGALRALVLDEADEMLRMGFIDDVQWILEQTPSERQIALFSATMPPVIRTIAEKHLNNPEQVTVKVKTTTAETIRQRYLIASGRQKMEALTRILEAEPFDGMIIFVRTKTSTEEIAEKLEARGFSASALNGDITQKMREATVNRLKNGQIDIIVATDVAARGLDVERISHVINYDIPQDTEPYVHRIGRTGRAGRKGDAILFIAPREKRMLYAIERATKQKIELFEMPTTESINNKRIAEFKQRITDTLESDESLELFSGIVDQYCADHEVSAGEVAAALAKMVQGDKSLLLKDAPKREFKERAERNPRFDVPEDKRRSVQNRRVETVETLEDASSPRPRREKPARTFSGPKPEKGMERYRLEVGEMHGVKPGNIVGAIANEMGLESEFIGNIQIMDDHSTVDLPEGMPRELYKQFCQIRVAGRTLDATSLSEPAGSRPPAPKKRRGGPSDARGGKRPPRRSDAPKGRGKPPRRK
ncbi:ATP-dependent RNA helicase CsdA [Mariprofundus ferrinatatus]|uniref:ATP-dependent RNA helicase DeaD n=1 Tax=Mariprofundus ferrinatatus TaxID=1921087 RepID=A0A2K8L8X1_9PROT|nr:DEAD/DEAH box helicase [Mariprofundus ferrinatatus]ATX82709.1 ATP-dependent RNA helicase CsdA [Mariprofundus ferrinatatus]